MIAYAKLLDMDSQKLNKSIQTAIKIIAIISGLVLAISIVLFATSNRGGEDLTGLTILLMPLAIFILAGPSLFLGFLIALILRALGGKANNSGNIPWLNTSAVVFIILYLPVLIYLATSTLADLGIIN